MARRGDYFWAYQDVKGRVTVKRWYSNEKRFAPSGSKVLDKFEVDGFVAADKFADEHFNGTGEKN